MAAPRTGYTTMTGDLLHYGHLRLLQTARALCDRLVVGVTTDALAVRQKRPPIVPLAQRVALLRGLHCVDAVVEHAGASKAAAYASLQFDVLFIGDDYLGAAEYADFQAAHPHVPVIYLPRTSGVSTSALLRRVLDRSLASARVLACTPTTHVVRVGADRVIKIARLGAAEAGPGTGDVYALADVFPRNWAWEPDFRPFPQCMGVNGRREIAVLEFLRAQRPALPWLVFLHACHDDHRQPAHGAAPAGAAGAALANAERAHPARTALLVQRFAGQTLDRFWAGLAECPPAEREARWRAVLRRVRAAVADLRRLGVAHGDLHDGNVAVGPDDAVSLLDFGWATWAALDLTPLERTRHARWLSHHGDWQHFLKALQARGLPLFELAEELAALEGFDRGCCFARTLPLGPRRRRAPPDGDAQPEPQDEQ